MLWTWGRLGKVQCEKIRGGYLILEETSQVTHKTMKNILGST